jgi:hypothetical protein
MATTLSNKELTEFLDPKQLTSKFQTIASLIDLIDANNNPVTFFTVPISINFPVKKVEFITSFLTEVRDQTTGILEISYVTSPLVYDNIVSLMNNKISFETGTPSYVVSNCEVIIPYELYEPSYINGDIQFYVHGLSTPSPTTIFGALSMRINFYGVI